MRLNQIIGLAIIAVALALGAGAYVLTSGQPLAVISSGKALVGGPFELTRHDGKRVSEKDFAGKYLLMIFGYTYCPDVCPTELQVVTAALNKLGKTGDVIQPAFVTIDPERDTPDIMREYVSNFHERMIGLTGSKDDVAKVAKAYRVYYNRAGDTDTATDYLMDHSSIIYLMGPDGEFVKHFTYSTDAEKLAEGLKAAISG